MKNIIFLWVCFIGLWACSEDKFVSKISEDQVTITFTETEGGSVMRYRIPGNMGIAAIQASYRNEFGEEVCKQASYLTDSIELGGFKTAKENIPVTILLLNEENEKLLVMQKSFRTKTSLAYGLLDKTEVKPYWGGFMMIIDSPKYMEGFANVFYVGTNPMTEKLDTLLLRTFQVEAGADTLYFTLEQQREKNTVIVNTEDVYGHLVRQKVYADVDAYQIEKMNPEKFEILDPENLVLVDEKKAWGPEYLFDGDTKGTKRYQAGNDLKLDYTFMMGPYAVGKYVILDLKEARAVASMRFYGIPYTNVGFYGNWDWEYVNKAPNEITVMASNTPEDESSWKKVGYYKESPTPSESCWAYRTYAWEKRLTSYEALLAADPCYVEVPFEVSPDTYQYYKIIIDSVFDGYSENNYNEYATFHELEVNVKK